MIYKRLGVKGKSWKAGKVDYKNMSIFMTDVWIKEYFNLVGTNKNQLLRKIWNVCSTYV